MFLSKAQYDLLFEILLIKLALRCKRAEQLLPRGAKLALSSSLLHLSPCLCGYSIYTSVYVGTCMINFLGFRRHPNRTGSGADPGKRIVNLRDLVSDHRGG